MFAPAVDFRELEYDVEFDDGPLGIELDIKLSVKCLAPGGQAQKGGVRVGSNMVAVAGVPVANIQELATAMKNASKPVTIRFRRKRRKKRKYAQQQSPAVKAEMEKKEKDYLQVSETSRSPLQARILSALFCYDSGSTARRATPTPPRSTASRWRRTPSVRRGAASSVPIP